MESNWSRLRYRVPLLLNGQNNLYSQNKVISPNSLVQLQLNNKSYQENYEIFRDRVLANIGRKYYPIYRMADGEFVFIIDAIEKNKKQLHQRIKKYLGNFKSLLQNQYMYGRKMPGNRWEKIKELFNENYVRVAHSESYNSREIEEFNFEFRENLRVIAEEGILAIHFVDGSSERQEYFNYYESVSQWFDYNNITLDESNYSSFYYIYTFLTGNDKYSLFRDKNILIITSLTDDKKNHLQDSINSFGASSIQFYDISPTKSMLEVLDLTKLNYPIEIVLIGAGIGSANILTQLKPLKTVCIDAGIVLERYANPALSKSRIFLL
jgi:hypothetical protein